MRSGKAVAALVAALSFVAIGCSDSTTVLNASFSTPTGLAVAGTGPSRLFVANHGEDTVQILTLGDNLGQMEFVPGPTQIFPLLIPAGAGPTDLAATADRRFVVVLASLTESLRVINADTLRLVRQGPVLPDAEAPVLEFALGDIGSRPVDMIGSPEVCAAPCAGWVYLALAGRGVVLGVEVRADGDVVSLERGRVFNVGGRPGRLAIGPAGRVLYATDMAAPDVVRIDIQTGAIERREIGGVGGPLAVSTDGRVLVVGRPMLRDVVVLRDADGPAFAVQDVNSAFAPIPECQRCCAGTDAAVCEALALDINATCDDAHPADRAVCVTASGLASEPFETYRAAYLGIVPAEIVTLGEGLDVPGAPDPSVLTVNCDDGERTYSEFAVIAGIDGTVRFVGLVDTAGEQPAPVVVSSSWCRAPTLVSGEDVAPLGSVLEPCSALEIPDGRARFACIADGAPDAAFDGSVTAGVVVAPGRTGNARWDLFWEGVVLKRVPGAGAITTEGPFKGSFIDLDPKIDLSELGIRGRDYVAGVDTTDPCAVDDADIISRGDILQIISEPLRSGSACSTAIEKVQEELDLAPDAMAAGACHFEREIVAVSKQDGNGVLQVCPRLLGYADCFGTGGSIDYKVRAGGQFLAVSPNEFERLRPGHRLGPGGHGGHGREIIFQTADGVAPYNTDACARYDGDGLLITQPACGVAADCVGGLACVGGRCVERCNEKEGDLLCSAYHRCDGVSDEAPEGVCVPVLTRRESDEPDESDKPVVSFLVSDFFVPLKAAHDFDQQGRLRGSAGRLPSAMLVTQDASSQPAIFVSYSVSDRVLGFVPFNNGGDIPDTSIYRLLR